MDYIKTVLKTIKDLGVTLVVDGDNIKAKGKRNPKAESLLIKHKDEIIKFFNKQNNITEAVSRGNNKSILSFKSKLRNITKWLMLADKKLWKDDMPIHLGSKLESKYTEVISSYIRTQDFLRNSFNFTGCIFNDRGCPDTSPVKCDGC